MKARAKSRGSSSRAVSRPRRPAARVEERLFALLGEHGHEQVSFASDGESGYRGIIAIHDTNVMEAFQDVLRLSRAMTYKAAVPGLNLGGGKSVIIGDPDTRSREPIFRAHGRHIERLGGRYITAEDVGTSPADQAHRKASEIYDTVLRVFAIAREEHIPSYKAADRLAERRLAEARKRKT